MIWLASFPRSGNTFLRNILFDVYGLKSSTFHRETDYPLDKNYASYPFIKTHELPTTLTELGQDTSQPKVYLVRDGRDALCSMAHHRSDLIEPGSDYYANLREAIVAEKGSFFGGWSQNAEQWLQRAQLIIRFEDLIREPLSSVERIRQLRHLPEADSSKLPTFEQMKHGIPQYGAGRMLAISEARKHQNAQKFFRRGTAGGWKDDMPVELQDLFWSYHGETMAKLGYTRDGAVAAPHPDLDGLLRMKLGFEPQRVKRKYRVLMEADKLVSPDNDGVKRYQVELLKAMYPVTENPHSKWDIDLYFRGHIRPLARFKDALFQGFSAQDIDENGSGLLETLLPTVEKPAPGELPEPEHSPINFSTIPHANIFLRFERALMASIPRGFVASLQRKNITLLHDFYEFFRAIVVKVSDLCQPVLPWAKASMGKLRTRSSRLAHEPEDQEQDKQEEPAYDLIHLPLKQNFRPFRNDSTKKIITIHDLTHQHFPEYHTAVNSKNAELGMCFARDSGADLIAISQATRSDILDGSDVTADKVHVIYEAADPVKFNHKVNQKDCLQVRTKYGVDFEQPYIICLSTLEPRKNLVNSVKAFISLLESDPDIELNMVIAGKKGWDSDGIYASAAAHPEHIFFTGFVDDDDLPYLYSDAMALSYVSFYEGFGLPPLEAMRCGTPVIYGDNSSMIEVIGDAGLLADPADFASIASCYLQILKDPTLRESMSRAALHKATQFSWRETAIQTLDLYEQVINAST